MHSYQNHIEPPGSIETSKFSCFKWTCFAHPLYLIRVGECHEVFSLRFVDTNAVVIKCSNCFFDRSPSQLLSCCVEHYPPTTRWFWILKIAYVVYQRISPQNISQTFFCVCVCRKLWCHHRRWFHGHGGLHANWHPNRPPLGAHRVLLLLLLLLLVASTTKSRRGRASFELGFLRWGRVKAKTWLCTWRKYPVFYEACEHCVLLPISWSVLPYLYVIRCDAQRCPHCIRVCNLKSTCMFAVCTKWLFVTLHNTKLSHNFHRCDGVCVSPKRLVDPWIFVLFFTVSQTPKGKNETVSSTHIVLIFCQLFVNESLYFIYVRSSLVLYWMHVLDGRCHAAQLLMEMLSFLK